MADLTHVLAAAAALCLGEEELHQAICVLPTLCSGAQQATASGQQQGMMWRARFLPVWRRLRRVDPGWREGDPDALDVQAYLRFLTSGGITMERARRLIRLEERAKRLRQV